MQIAFFVAVIVLILAGMGWARRRAEPQAPGRTAPNPT
jgi:hypothetical protein